VFSAGFAGWDRSIDPLLKRVQVTFRWGCYIDGGPLLLTKTELSLVRRTPALIPMLPHLDQWFVPTMRSKDGMAVAHDPCQRADLTTTPLAHASVRTARDDREQRAQKASADHGRRNEDCV